MLHVPQTTISRWEQGHVALDVIQIFELEQALGLEAGSILLAAGLATSPRTVKDVGAAILSDPNIDAVLRRDLHTLYEHYVRFSRPSRR